MTAAAAKLFASHDLFEGPLHYESACPKASFYVARWGEATRTEHATKELLSIVGYRAGRGGGIEAKGAIEVDMGSSTVTYLPSRDLIMIVEELTLRAIHAGRSSTAANQIHK